MKVSCVACNYNNNIDQLNNCRVFTVWIVLSVSTASSQKRPARQSDKTSAALDTDSVDSSSK